MVNDYFSGRDRSKYLLIKTAKIIAMTCTHAALRRRDLVELNFKVVFRLIWGVNSIPAVRW